MKMEGVMHENEISEKIIGCAIALGLGLLERRELVA
jgi:hypothetical protein